MKIDSKIIYNIAFFSIIFMYIRIIPVNIETQPVFVVILIPIFIAINKMKVSIKSEDRFLIVYLIITFIYFIVASLLGVESTIIHYFKLILGPLAYLLILKNVDLLEIRTLKSMTILLFIISFIYFFHIPIIYDFINSIINLLLNRYTANYIGARGMSILTPEPSYFVYFAMLLLYSFDFIESKLNLKENIVYKVLIYVMCIITKSALVYMFILIYLTLKYLYCNNNMKINNIIKILIMGITIALFIIICTKLFNIDLSNNRLQQIINSSHYDNIFETLFYSDESSGFRFIINTIYILSIFVKPFGYGLGGMETQWSNVARLFNIDYARNGIFVYTYNDYTSLPAQAYIPNVIGSIGIFSILIIIFIYKNNVLNNSKLRKSILIVISLFMWILQSNMFNPVFWILIGICKYNNEKKGEKNVTINVENNKTL